LEEELERHFKKVEIPPDCPDCPLKLSVDWLRNPSAATQASDRTTEVGKCMPKLIQRKNMEMNPITAILKQ
jgi:hypothetical protein